MHQVKLSDQLYQEAARCASAAGFQSVDDYVAEVLQNGLGIGIDNDPMEHLEVRFTPKAIQALDDAMAEVKAGYSFSPEEVDARIAEKRKAWLKNQAD